MQKLESSEDINSESRLWHSSEGSSAASWSSRQRALRPSPPAPPHQLLASRTFLRTLLASGPATSEILLLLQPQNHLTEQRSSVGGSIRMPGRRMETWTAGPLPEFLSQEVWGGAWEFIFLIIAPVMLMLVLRTTLWKSLPWVFLSLQHSPLSNPIDPYPLHQKWNEKFRSRMYITSQLFERWKTHSVQTPTQPWQIKTHLISAASLPPPTHIYPSSQFPPLHRWSGLCVCLYIASHACLRVHICVSPSPLLNYKVLECLSL